MTAITPFFSGLSAIVQNLNREYPPRVKSGQDTELPTMIPPPVKNACRRQSTRTIVHQERETRVSITEASLPQAHFSGCSKPDGGGNSRSASCWLVVLGSQTIHHWGRPSSPCGDLPETMASPRSSTAKRNSSKDEPATSRTSPTTAGASSLNAANKTSTNDLIPIFWRRACNSYPEIKMQNLVGAAGLEPARSFLQQILSLLRLPFRHAPRTTHHSRKPSKAPALLEFG